MYCASTTAPPPQSRALSSRRLHRLAARAVRNANQIIISLFIWYSFTFKIDFFLTEMSFFLKLILRMDVQAENLGILYLRFFP